MNINAEKNEERVSRLNWFAKTAQIQQWLFEFPYSRSDFA